MFSFTTFVLGASWFDEIATGLAVRMNIDSTGTGFWLVSLAKSVITTEGDDPGNPNRCYTNGGSADELRAKTSRWG